MVTVILPLLLAAGASASADPGYHWPLDLPRIVTGSFGEYRHARFHAGIDLRTGGDGVPVRAARDGHVSRLRCSAFGYGKAVYVDFDDGNSAVYAHLDDYRADLAEYVRMAQHERQSYEVDLHLPEGRFAVERGEVIGYSGTTGTSAPHLHYELRDSRNRPINPLHVGITWEDNTAPTLNRLLITPDAPRARINGDYLPVILPIDGRGEGHTVPRVGLEGRANVSLDVIDHQGAYRHGPYEMRLSAGDTEIFRMRHDLISYENLRGGAVGWVPFALSEGRFLACWRWPGNDVESYAFSLGTGWVSAEDGPVDALLVATDAHGNRSSVTMPFYPGDSDLGQGGAAESGGTGAVSIDWHGLYWSVTVEFPQAEGAMPVLRGTPQAGFVPGPFVRVGPGTFRAAFALEGTGVYGITVDHPRIDEETLRVGALQAGAPASLDFGFAAVSAGADSAFGVLYAQAERVGQPSGDGVRALGDAVLIEPLRAPIKDPVRIRLPIPPGADEATNLALYRWSGGWTWLGGDRRGDVMEAETNRWGVFVLGEDTQPPAIAFETPPANYRAQTRRPHIRATIRDAGSGIRDYEIRCGGQWLLAEYTPRRNEIRWVRDADLPPGEQEITITVTDRAGNRSVARRTVVIPG